MDAPELEILDIKPPSDLKKIETHPNYFQLPCCSIHVAPPKSGKGICIMNQLLNPAFNLFEKLDQVHLYSPTATSGDPSFRHFVELNKGRIYSEYSDKHLRKILDNQLSYPKNKRPSIAIIFDDIGTFVGVHKNSLLFSLSSNYRHFGIELLYYCVQKFRQLPPIVRSCVDYALISRCKNKKELDDMESEIGHKYDGQFALLLNQATAKPYSFLYLRLNHNPSEAFECFTRKIYTAKSIGFLDIEHDSLNHKKSVVDEEKD